MKALTIPQDEAAASGVAEINEPLMQYQKAWGPYRPHSILLRNPDAVLWYSPGATLPNVRATNLVRGHGNMHTVVKGLAIVTGPHDTDVPDWYAAAPLSDTKKLSAWEKQLQEKLRVIFVPSERGLEVEVSEAKVGDTMKYHDPILDEPHLVYALYNPAALLVAKWNGGEGFNERVNRVLQRHLGSRRGDRIYGDAYICWRLNERDDELTELYLAELDNKRPLPPRPPEYDYDLWHEQMWGH